MDIEEYLKQKRELQKRMEKEGSDMLKTLLASFFKENPTVEAIRWTQYAPYFNDGEPCVFSVHEVLVKFLSPDEKESDENYDDDDEGFMYSWDFRDEDDPETKKFFKNVSKLSNLLSGELEDLCEMVFGNDAQITVSRLESGEIEIETAHYEHD